jgi:thioesterase DpgC
MTVHGTLPDVDRWRSVGPEFDGTFGDDTAAFAEHVGLGERLLAGLPVKPLRDQEQQRRVDAVLESSRRWRDRYITLHADRVYAALTNGRTAYRSLSDLAFAAAERFPGLVPDRPRLAVESALPQADKDGLEIDQGIFFRGVLRSPVAGAHLVDTMLRTTPRAEDLLDRFRRDGHVDLGAVLVERRGAIAHLTVHNEHCLNAEDNGLIDDMETAVDLALRDDAVRVGVLRGGVMTHRRYLGKRVFSAGINLKDLRDGRISYADFLLRRELGYINKLVRGVAVDGGAERTVQKPWVAAVDSFAIGGGMQLLLTFDHVIAASDSFFSLPAAQEGIVPGAANFRLSRSTGGRLARQIILFGRRIQATDPAAATICDEVVSPLRMDAAVETAASALDNPAVVANRRMLNLAEEPADRFREYMAEFAYAQAVRLYSADVLDKVGGRG